MSWCEKNNSDFTGRAVFVRHCSIVKLFYCYETVLRSFRVPRFALQVTTATATATATLPFFATFNFQLSIFYFEL